MSKEVTAWCKRDRTTMYIHQNHSPRIAEPTWANPTDDQGGGANMMSVYQLTGDIKDVKNPLRHPWLV